MHGMMVILPVVIWLLVMFPARRDGRAPDARRVRRRRSASTRRELSADREPGISGQVFRIAAANHGRITVSDVVVHIGLDVSDAESVMDRLVDGVRVRLECTDEGRVYYEFPEIIERLDTQNNRRRMKPREVEDI